MEFNYLNTLGMQIGFPIWLTVVLVVWTLAWKLTALWKSARNKHIVWFMVMGLANTLGIIPILYIFIFSKLGKNGKIKEGSKGVKLEMKVPEKKYEKPRKKKVPKKKISRKKK